MAGAVFLGSGGTWTTSSGIFYWVVGTLAGLVTDPALASRLGEISEHNLGSIDLEDLDETQRGDLLAAIAALPDAAAVRLPESGGREAVLAQIAELARGAREASADEPTHGAGSSWDDQPPGD